ncbi:MAG TPA: RluA family pseudouridine synthase [Candidatus Methylomirabilis sp.]|nr:RluA family pseudouridine synthase [Candidatus Methylomirabilis sp.]
MTLLDRLGALHPGASRRTLKQWLERGRVEVAGAVVRDGRVSIGPGDRVALRAGGEVPFPPRLRLVHEDAALLVIDKPPGLLSIASERERERTAYRLIWDYLAAGRPPRRPFVVHRLDRDTSGLLVFAKSPAAKQKLQEQFEMRTAERVYLAVVEGRVRADAGSLASRLRHDRALRVSSGPAGKLAITHYRVLARRRDTTALEIVLGTGRRHQIRVQLAEMGHPIAGDREHGSRTDPFGRLALHARRLALVHPSTGRAVSFESAPPPGWV